MDRAFSVDDIADQFWSSPPPMRLSQATELDLDSSSATTTKMMNRSSSEWAFQQYLQEATATATDCTESSSSSPLQQKNVIEIKDQIFNNRNLNTKPKSNLTSFGSGIPSNVAIDSDEYQAFLKSRLDLACAAVAFTRSNYVKTQDPAELAPVKVSQEANASESGSRIPPKESEQELTKAQHKEPGGLVGMPSLPEVQKKPVVQVRSTTSGSSREQSDDDEAEGEAETTQNKDGTDVKRVRRMLSNRESARRSRRRKQAHLTDLETQVSQHRVENSSLLKRLTDISQKYNESAVDNRVLKADVETLRAKVKMAEETVKRVTGLNPFFQAMSEISTMVMPSFTGSPSDTSGDAAVPVQDEPKHHYYQATPNSHMSTHDPRIQNGMIDISTLENVQQNPATAATGNKIGRTSSMQRVASLEHLQKRIRGEASPRGT